jgi:hypothetical protein
MIKYKDGWIAKGSFAYEMYEKKQFEQLDKHIKMLQQKEENLIKKGLPKTDPKPTN